MTRYQRHPAEYQAARDARQHRAMIARRADRAAADRIRSTFALTTTADALAISETFALVTM
jgi:hypothetical protein